nr:hypothetical protein Iba_chr08aCG10240 [Ipomoea batatas]
MVIAGCGVRYWYSEDSLELEPVLMMAWWSTSMMIAVAAFVTSVREKEKIEKEREWHHQQSGQLLLRHHQLVGVQNLSMVAGVPPNTHGVLQLGLMSNLRKLAAVDSGAKKVGLRVFRGSGCGSVEEAVIDDMRQDLLKIGAEEVGGGGTL